jgi:cyanophycinase
MDERGREGDLLPVIAAHPNLLGIGLDTGTAIVVHGDRFRVIGNGQVAIYDKGTRGPNDAGYYFLSHGDELDLASKRRR